jgi:hypothetical protein
MLQFMPTLEQSDSLIRLGSRTCAERNSRCHDMVEAFHELWQKVKDAYIVPICTILLSNSKALPPDWPFDQSLCVERLNGYSGRPSRWAREHDDVHNGRMVVVHKVLFGTLDRSNKRHTCEILHLYTAL